MRGITFHKEAGLKKFNVPVTLTVKIIIRKVGTRAITLAWPFENRTIFFKWLPF